jgi:hypothetical protein
MVSLLASCEGDRGFDPRSGQTNDYTIGICCFSPTHATLRRMRKNWSSRNQNNVCEWTVVSVGYHYYMRTFSTQTYLIMTTIKSSSSSSSFNTEKLQRDEGYFPAHAWHDNGLLIFIFYNF